MTGKKSSQFNYFAPVQVRSAHPTNTECASWDVEQRPSQFNHYAQSGQLTHSKFY